MPRKVDHPTRRAAIAEAVWRLTARGGIEAVTMRHVAADAGMSLGQVQHYFHTKDDLLSHAYDLLTQDPAPPPDPAPRAAARAALTPRLPLDEHRTLRAHVTLAYLARAAAAPDAATQVHKTHAALHALVVDQIHRGQRRGHVPLHLDPDREARTLLALLDGLAAHVLAGHQSPADAEQALDAHLDGLFTD